VFIVQAVSEGLAGTKMEKVEYEKTRISLPSAVCKVKMDSGAMLIWSVRRLLS
jgi:hypothetical protein